MLGRRLARGAGRGEMVGLMLPNSVGAALAFLGLQATGRVPAMLNHTSGVDGVLSSCRAAGLRRVVTSRRFVELAKLDALAEHLAAEVELVWLEDVRASSASPTSSTARSRAFRRLAAPPPAPSPPSDPGGGAVHLGLGRRAERRWC